jgi:hypothetical protein
MLVAYIPGSWFLFNLATLSSFHGRSRAGDARLPGGVQGVAHLRGDHPLCVLLGGARLHDVHLHDARLLYPGIHKYPSPGHSGCS